jgi:amino-acid N-acetyltransferase
MKFRKAKMADVESIHGLINNYANQGMMLARSRNMLYETIREFTVAVDENDQVVGAAGLHIIWEDLAEVRALAMDERYRGKGVGRALVNNLIGEAKELGIFRVFSLTYQQGFFEQVCFHVVTKDELPHKVWKECINCAKFPNCDEIAMVIDL